MSTKAKDKSKKPNSGGLDLSDDPLLKIVKEMDNVDIKDKKASDNETSNDDNKGGRYFYPFFYETTRKKK